MIEGLRNYGTSMFCEVMLDFHATYRDSETIKLTSLQLFLNPVILASKLGCMARNTDHNGNKGGFIFLQFGIPRFVQEILTFGSCRSQICEWHVAT